MEVVHEGSESTFQHRETIVSGTTGNERKRDSHQGHRLGAGALQGEPRTSRLLFEQPDKPTLTHTGAQRRGLGCSAVMRALRRGCSAAALCGSRKGDQPEQKAAHAAALVSDSSVLQAYSLTAVAA